MSTYSISELAAELDITARTIRYYEEEGLIQPSRQGRVRVYSQGDRTRLKLTLRGKRLGFTLAEIKQLVGMYENKGDNVGQLQAFLQVLQKHQEQLLLQRSDIDVTLSEIRQHLQRCRKLLKSNP